MNGGLTLASSPRRHRVVAMTSVGTLVGEHEVPAHVAGDGGALKSPNRCRRRSRRRRRLPPPDRVSTMPGRRRRRRGRSYRSARWVGRPRRFRRPPRRMRRRASIRMGQRCLVPCRSIRVLRRHPCTVGVRQGRSRRCGRDDVDVFMAFGFQQHSHLQLSAGVLVRDNGCAAACGFTQLRTTSGWSISCGGTVHRWCTSLA